MTLNDVLCKLELAAYCDVLTPVWEEAKAARPAELFFLAPEFLAEAGDWCSLPAEATEVALAAAGRLAESPAAVALAWYFHYCLYRVPGFDRERIYAWPPTPGCSTCSRWSPASRRCWSTTAPTASRRS